MNAFEIRPSFQVGNMELTIPFGNQSVEIEGELFRSLLSDGRQAAPIMEESLSARFGFELENNCARYDMVQNADKNNLPIPDGAKIEARNITPGGGTYIVPSGQVGSGREYDRKNFMKKLKTLSESGGGYIFTDIRNFESDPNIQIYYVSAKIAYEKFKTGCYGKPLKKPGHNISGSNFDRKMEEISVYQNE